jgi:hypothetical protein
VTSFLKGILANSASGNFVQTLNPRPSSSPLHRRPINRNRLRSTPPPPRIANTMPTNTRSNKPRNRSGLQREQPPAAEKRKRAESGADTSKKKAKATTNETTDDVNDDSQVTRKGKEVAGGKGKGTKRARCVATPATSLPSSRRLGKPQQTTHRTMLPLMRQVPPAILPGMCPP